MANPLKGINDDTSNSILIKDFFPLEDLSKKVSELSDKIPFLKWSSTNEYDEEDGLLEQMYQNNEMIKYPNYMLFANNKQMNKKKTYI